MAGTRCREGRVERISYELCVLCAAGGNPAPRTLARRCQPVALPDHDVPADFDGNDAAGASSFED